MNGEKSYAVVLADDVAALRRLVKMALQASGRFRVVGEAGTGYEAIEQAKAHQPDLVLLDLSMPDLDGLEALPRVLEAAPKTHVVVLSGFNHVRMAPVAKRMGASGYLEKGLEPDALVRELLALLEPSDPAGGLGPSKPMLVAPAPGAASAPPSPPVRPKEAKPAEGSFRALVIEADATAADRIAHVLDAAHVAHFHCSHAESLHAAELRLEAREADVVLVNPEGLGAGPEEIFIEVLSRAAGVPVVALVPPHDVGVVAGALRLGIEDCLDPATSDADMVGRSLLYALERRRAQDARRQVRDQQAELDRLRSMEALKTQFFNAAAHELGTPLTPIRLQVSMLRKMGDTTPQPVVRRSLDILERNVERLSKLNQDILDVARLQAGRLSIEKRPLDVKGVVRDAVDTFEPVAIERGVGLTATCPEGLVANADPQRLLQVLYNLVSNALKFTPAGGVVSIEVEGNAHEVHVNVRDSGPGLEPEQIAKLFQPFSQVLGGEQPRGVGTGLGLFVSRGIIELHGGHIECRSPGRGQGCTFSFTVPGMPMPKPTLPAMPAPAPSPSAPPAKRPAARTAA